LVGIYVFEVEKNMFVCIIGGFLGSGKTTLLMKVAAQCKQRGMSAAILVNEMGEIGIDGATMKAEGYDAIELPDGCICCSLSGTLQNALKNIDRDIHPDILIIEPTGLALPHKVEELVHTSLIDSDHTVIIGIADATRFDELMKAKEEFFKRQLVNSEFILLTKSDIVNKEEIERISKEIKNIYPKKDVIPVSSIKGTGLNEVYARLIK
jgi:Putative GTPases (G3E family)